jgi:chorismate dehydratase
VSAPDAGAKLRLTAPESLEAEATRLERERRAVDRQREDDLGDSLAPFRVGSVPHLNTVPLTRGLEDQIVYHPPSRLAELLHRGELDAALISVTEVLSADRYDVLDGIAVASLGEVKSVFLAHRGPLEAAQVVHCDPTSLASRRLLEVLLAERGLHLAFKPLVSSDPAALPDYFMLIGDQGLDFQLRPHEHEIWDLGSAWFELTQLPFVYAVWALARHRDHAPLRRRLREARRLGLDTLEAIIRTSRPDYPYELRKDYLSWHIHYHLGSDEKRGVARFLELLRAHVPGPWHEPRYVM